MVRFRTCGNVVSLTAVHKDGVKCSTPGNSGGPWIQHEANGNLVKIVGTHVGGINNYKGTGHKECFYEQIGAILRAFKGFVP
jgi:hypothetical protein